MTALIVLLRHEARSAWPAMAIATGLLFLASVVFLFPGRPQRNGPGYFARTRNELRNIAGALRVHHNINGSFPPLFISGPDGKPMHSWRVLLMPHLGWNRSFESSRKSGSYDLDEPWDGSHNQKFSPRSQFPYPTFGYYRSTDTRYVAIVGERTMWSSKMLHGQTQFMRRRDVRDKPENTILIVAVEDSGIHWMEPIDFVHSQESGTINSKTGKRGLQRKHMRSILVVTADGKLREIP